MGSSLVLTGGAATAKTLKESISLASHGFTVGDVIRWNNGSPSYIRAQADSAANAEVLGIVSAKVDTNTFELTYGGYIDLPQFAGISYPVLFLSGVCAGGLTHNPPSALGTVVKPVVTRHPTLNGFVLNNYLGTQIGGSSTIGIDEIQPVGTIMPFAGTVTPDTWLPCNGSEYAVSDYPELYSKLCYDTGDRVPMYGYVAELTLNTIPNGTALNDYVMLPKDGSSLPDPVPDGSTNTEPASIAQALLVEGNIIAIDTVNKKITVKTTWRYNSTKKYFEYPNAAFKVATNYTIVFGGGWVAGSFRGTVNGTQVTAVRITQFLSPDLKSRFIVGSADSGFNAQPENATYSSGSLPEDNSRGTTYASGAFGGEEKHTLTTAEMPNHSHPLQGKLTTALTRTPGGGEVQVQGGTDSSSITTPFVNNVGGDQPHNNMPPYMAVRYIIKAKPYTRAAIIDGVDLPYSNLLVRSTDSNSLRSELLSGASGGDLVFYTNSGEASKTGTERMRLTNRNGLRLTQQDGYTFGINIIGSGNQGSTTPTSVASFLKFYNPETPINPYTWWCPRDGIALSVESHSTNEGAITDQYSNGGVGTPLFTVTSVGNVGIGFSSPGATLDVNGTVRIRGGGLPGMSLGDRLVAADTSGTLKWDTELIKAQDNAVLSINFNSSAGGGWTDSLAGTTVFTGNMSARTDVYSSTTATLKRGVWLVQPYNNLTYSPTFRATTTYFGRIGVQAISGVIIGTVGPAFPGINIGFNYDSNGAKFNDSTYGYSPNLYDMIPFMVYVTSDTATVKGIIKHMDGGTISVVGNSSVGMGFSFYRIS